MKPCHSPKQIDSQSPLSLGNSKQRVEAILHFVGVTGKGRTAFRARRNPTQLNQQVPDRMVLHQELLVELSPDLYIPITVRLQLDTINAKLPLQNHPARTSQTLDFNIFLIHFSHFS